MCVAKKCWHECASERVCSVLKDLSGGEEVLKEINSRSSAREVVNTLLFPSFHLEHDNVILAFTVKEPIF